MKTLEFIRNAGETRRFHTFPVLREQRVDAHSWQVAMLLWYIFGGREPGVRMELIMAALTHDMAEHKVGDLPSPGKRWLDNEYTMVHKDDGDVRTFREAWGRMEQGIQADHGQNWECFLTDEEKEILKFCDVAEGALHCIRERALGNQLIAEAFHNFRKYVEEIVSDKARTYEVGKESVELWDDAHDLVDYIDKEWKIVNGQ